MMRRKLWRRSVCVAAMLVAVAAVPALGAGMVLFDEGHGERFVAGRSEPLDLSGLAEQFVRQGLVVKPVALPLTDDLLAGADVLVVSGAFAPLAPAEMDAVLRFVTRGGRLAVMLHVGAPVADLLHRLEVDVSNGVIHERHDVINGQDANFHVSRLAPHPLFAGLRHFGLYGGWALMSTGAGSRVIAETSPDAWVDLDGDRKLSAGDAVQSFGVCVAGEVGKGRFVVFGDDAIFQNKFLDAENLTLARNLVHWLAGGDEDDLLARMHGP